MAIQSLAKTVFTPMHVAKFSAHIYDPPWLAPCHIQSSFDPLHPPIIGKHYLTNSSGIFGHPAKPPALLRSKAPLARISERDFEGRAGEYSNTPTM